MAVERIRVYNSATELKTPSCKYTESSDAVTNTAVLGMEADTNLQIGTVLDFKQKDGSTTQFSAKVNDIKEVDLWTVTCYAGGYELIGKRIQKVYASGTAPEGIVEDIIDNFTDSLTYASVGVSGFTFDFDFIADGYLVDVIKEMMDLLNYKLRITQSGNVYFEAEGALDNGATLSNGVNYRVEQWEESKQSLINKVRITGGNISNNRQETLSGTNTVFTLTSKPKGNVRVTVGGTEQSAATYSTNPESKEITFASSVSNPVVSYEFDRPIIVEDEDQASIAQYGEEYQNIPAPHILTTTDARKYAREVLNVYAQPTVSQTGFIPYLDWNLQVNEIVSVSDSYRSKINIPLIIQKIERDIVGGETKLYLGTLSQTAYDWQREVQDRIKKLERRATNEDQRVFVKSFPSDLNIVLDTEYKIYTASPQNTLKIGHDTLGYIRDTNDEIDCSGNGNHGVWSGTAVGGSQFELTGYRLSNGYFQGAEKITSTGVSEAGIRSVCWFHKDMTTCGIIRLDTGKDINLISGVASTSGLTGVTATNTTEGSWVFTYVEFDSITMTNPIIGETSSFADGRMDELMVFDKTLSALEKQELIDKKMHSGHSLYPNCKLWYSFDNNQIEDNETTQVLVDTI